MYTLVLEEQLKVGYGINYAEFEDYNVVLCCYESNIDKLTVKEQS